MAQPQTPLCPRCGSDDIFVRGENCLCASCGERFTFTAQPAPFQPLHLFLSYGHTEDIVCRRIVQALKARGHDVWFDEDRLHAGQDWRQGITEGIAHSNGVIACLSRHSVRDPGVCLNELSIAIGIRGGNIKTILLEPEQSVVPPASLCHIQWLDMSDWHARYEQGEEVFAPWFDAKMQELFAVLESDENRACDGEITALREKLHINYDTGKQHELLRRPFVGREWLTEQVERWLDDANGARLCMLYGDPGVGKSAFAAHYIHYNPRVAAGLFCEYDRPTYNSAAAVTMTLAWLLACRLPAYRTVLAEIVKTEKQLEKLAAGELFDRLLAEPLDGLVIDGGQETLCIVIDGLDECGRGEQNALAEVLARYTPRLPAWLRVLVTSREVAAVKAPLDGAFALRLDSGGAQNSSDVRLYFTLRLQDRFGADPDWETALDTLTERSGGIFLYARLVCEGLLAGRVTLADVDRFPAGLSGVFVQWFGWFFPDDSLYKEAFRLPLGLLLAAPAPLPEEELGRILGWDDNRREDFLRTVEVLLRRGSDAQGRPTLVFSHQYLDEWLDSPSAGRYRSSRAAAQKKMAESFFAFFRTGAQRMTDYEARHLLPLLRACGMTGEADFAMLDHELLWRFIAFARQEKTWEAALDCAQQAQAMAAAMVARRNTLEDYREMELCYGVLAEVWKRCARYDTAMECHRQALALARRLAEVRGLVNDVRDLGLVCLQTVDTWNNGLIMCVGFPSAQAFWDNFGDPTEYLRLLQEALAIFRRLVKGPGELRDYRGLHAACRLMLDLPVGGAERDDLALCREMVACAQHLHEESGMPADHARLQDSWQRLAQLRRKTEGAAGEAAVWREALIHWRRMAGLRGSEEDLFDISYGTNKAARALVGNEAELPARADLYREGLAAATELASRRGEERDRRTAAILSANLARVLRKQGAPEEALRYLRDAVRWWSGLARPLRGRASRADRRAREDRRALLEDCLAVLELLEAGTAPDMLSDLCRWLQESIRPWRKLPDHTPEELSAAADLYGRAAGLLRRRGEEAQAVSLYRDALVLALHLVSARGAEEDNRLVLLAHGSLCQSPEVPKEERLEHIRRGREIARRLLEKTGKDEYRAYLASFAQEEARLKNTGD